MQDQDGATRGRDAVHRRQLPQEFVWRGRVRCGYVFEPGVITQPAPFSLEVFEASAACNSECPRSKQFGLFQPHQLPSHHDENVLEHVVGVKGAHQSAQVTVQRRLDASKQEFQRIAVTALCSQHPQ